MESTLKGKLDWFGHRLTVEGSCSCGAYHHREIYEPRIMHNHAREEVAVYTCPACREVYIVKADKEAAE